MRRLSALASVTALIAVLVACTSGGAPGWTYAPAPSITAAPSGGASGAPGGSAPAGSGSPAASAPASAPASSQPSAGGSAGASGGTGAAITITAPVGAATSGFQPATAQAPANAAFEIDFDNQDNQAPHNLIVQDANGTAVPVTGDTAPFQGPAKKAYMIAALGAGSYKFVCQVHPSTMIGELTVQ